MKKIALATAPLSALLALFLLLSFSLTGQTQQPAAAPKNHIQVVGLLTVIPQLLTQAPDAQQVQRLRDLEANDWIEMDTIVSFDPNLYEEKVSIFKNDLSPQKDVSGEMVYQDCDQPPSFPGGPAALKHFLAENLHYPEDAQKIKFTGQTLVTFTIRKDGSVQDVQAQPFETGRHDVSRTSISREVDIAPLAPALNQLLEQEAIRVVKTMPKLLPGKQHGGAVACHVMLPITFEVQ